MFLWIEFFLAALVIVLSGVKLSRYADELARRTGLGRGLIGLAVLSTITSLPELVTTLSAAVHLRQPDLALGNIFGSNCFNMVIIAVLDAVLGAEAIADRVRSSHVRPAAWAVGVTALALGSLALHWDGEIVPGLRSSSVMIIAGYFLAMWFIVCRREPVALARITPIAASAAPFPAPPPLQSLPIFCLKATLATVGIVAAGLWMTMICERIAEVYGLARSFIGTLFLATATSLPELVVSLASFAFLNFNLAIGNLFGSNIFNLAILGVAGQLAPGESIFIAGGRLALLPGGVSIIMCLVAMFGLRAKGQRTFLRMGWASWALVIMFLGVNWALFAMGQR